MKLIAWHDLPLDKSIDRVDATCFGDQISIHVKGMPLVPFVRSISNDTKRDLTDLVTQAIRGQRS